MSRRRYKINDLPPGQRGRCIEQIEVDEHDREGHRVAILWLPPGVLPETQFDIRNAISNAYSMGREDRSAELPQECAAGHPQSGPRPATNQDRDGRTPGSGDA